MKTPWIILILVMLGEIGFPGFHQVSAKELPKLEIIRKANPKPEKKADQVPGDPNEIITRVYVVDPTFLSIGTDPFASNGPLERKTAIQILETAGIPFPSGTSAIYNPGTSQLIVHQTFDKMAKVELFLEEIRSEVETVASFRFEIFQLPAPLAREILKSSLSKQDHSEERASVIKWVAAEKAQWIHHTEVSVREGKRTGVTEGSEYHFVASYKRDNKTNKLLPVFETRNVGTSVEVQSHSLEDDSKVYFEFDFEHHYSAPMMETTGIQILGDSGVITIQVPRFHSLKIYSEPNTLMQNNSVKLIGHYLTSEVGGNQANTHMGIVFLRASVQPVR